MFAGVCVTLLRALGIACRPVTCYNSAHFCSTKLGQVDRYFSTDGELVDELSRDQIWYGLKLAMYIIFIAKRLQYNDVLVS